MAAIACASCAHKNALHRGFCGGCGTTLRPVCRGCRFVNERYDRYCGGCGSPLAFEAGPARSAPVVAPPTNELNGLFEVTSLSTPDENLPAANITQGDLDKLFGGGS